MLTCDLCIFGGKGARAFSVEDIEEGKEAIEREMAAASWSDEQQANPLVVLRTALGK